MGTTPEWLMVYATIAYLIATVAIFVANLKSVKATRDQLEESKRQYKETQRLQTMPYLQLRVGDCIRNKDGSTAYIPVKFENADNDNTVYGEKSILFVNEGLGLLHHISMKWDVKINEGDELASGDIFSFADAVIPPHGEWGKNILIMANKHEYYKKVYLFRIHIQYEDLLGNKYKQEATIVLRNDSENIKLLENSITSPERI